MSLSAGSNTENLHFPNSPNPLPTERWYFEIERNKDYVAIRASTGDDDSTFEYSREYTFPSGSSRLMAELNFLLQFDVWRLDFGMLNWKNVRLEMILILRNIRDNSHWPSITCAGVLYFFIVLYFE